MSRRGYEDNWTVHMRKRESERIWKEACVALAKNEAYKPKNFGCMKEMVDIVNKGHIYALVNKQCEPPTGGQVGDSQRQEMVHV